MIKDPVCGMEIEEEDFTLEFEGKKYYFCSAGCKNKFKNSPRKFSREYIHDLVIIGGGPAGVTAAVYASVLKIDTMVVTMDIGGQAVDSSKIKNYMGFDFITGKELTNKFKNQFLHQHYLDHMIDEVVKINRKGKSFEVLTKSGRTIRTRSVIIATGMKRRRLGVPGEERLLRKGVSYSSVQDTALFKGMDVVVIGGGNSGIQTANDLKNLGCQVTLVSQGELIGDDADIEKLRKSGKVEILEGYDVEEIRGKDKVESVVVQARDSRVRKEIPCRGVFIQIGLLPNTEFCRGLVKLNEKGEIVINPDCSTNVEGIFACGDVTNAFGKRIVIASGEGAKAALRAKKYLLKKKEMPE
ncbi:MAG: FAD-dependent oxidoreductase [Caldiserica bacterium]|nr:FAD-dependent oxidoreductase [Caldisericota bacterium]